MIRTEKGAKISSLALVTAILSVFLQFTSGMFSYYLEISPIVGYSIQIVEFLTFGFTIILLATNSHKNPRIFGIIALLYIYAIFITIIGAYYSFPVFLKKIVEMTYWACVMYIFYTYFKSNEYKDSLSMLFFVFHTFLVVVFFVTYSEARKTSMFSDVDILLNSSYYIIFALPLALTCKKSFFQYVAIITTYVTTIISEKRGALLSVLLITIVWFLFSEKKISFLKKIKQIIFFIVVSFVAYFILISIIREYNLSTLERLNNLFSGYDDGSGRGEIWSKCFEIIANDNIFTNLFGRGYDSLRYSGNYGVDFYWAHNDFIQMILDYGFCGLFLFILFIVELCKLSLKFFRIHDSYSVLFLMSIILVLMNCTVSMCFVYSYWILGISAFWGLCLGKSQRRR